MSFDTDISTVIEGSREIYELLQVIGNAEDTGEAIEAAKKLKEQVNISENFTRIIDDYLMFFTNTEKIAAADLSPMVFSSRTLELVQLLSEKPEEEPDEDTFGRIREIVRKSELYDKGVKERIYELAAGEAVRREGISEGEAVSSEAGERISQLINTENVSELSFENINEVRNLILRNAVTSDRIIRDSVRELLTEESSQGTEISPEEAAVLDKAGAAIIEYLSNENINELSFENTQQLKEIVRKSTQLSLKEKEKLLETVTAGQVKMLKEAQTETQAENELKQELITLIQETGKVSVSEPVAERIKTIINSLSGSISKYNLFFEEETRHIERERKTAVERILATKEFDSILEQTITEYENENPEDREKSSDRATIRQEVIRILRAGKPEEILTGAAAEIQKIYTSLQSNIQNYRVTSATNEPGQEIAGSAEEIAVLGKKIAGETPSTIIYESSTEEPEEEETKAALVIKRDELVKLIRDYRTSESRETVKTSEVRDIINQIQISGKKQRAAAFPGGTGYVEAKKPQEPEIVPKESPEEAAEAEPLEEKGKEKAVSDEDIRKLTESVNRINVENELRRRQYLETVRNFESKKPKQSHEDALAKTRKRAIMALESPETLRETLESERVVKENREKEIFKELQGIFPDQSMEIYQLFNRYQSNPEQLYEENILRPAEVGELMFDINDATRAPAEREEQSVAKILAEAVSELPKDSERVKALIRQEEAVPSRTPAETVHKFTETLSSDELNEQLEMMRHNLTRQIKEEVKSDVVTESHNVNAKEVVTTDNTTQQISQVNIQRMIDNTVRSEMNTISNQVMSKIERQMRNEKIRRGY